MWKIVKTFPQTPEGEELVLFYYEQDTQQYVKLTRKHTCLYKYSWDGFSANFNNVKIELILSSVE